MNARKVGTLVLRDISTQLERGNRCPVPIRTNP
jgi:hypothetical protein